MGRSAKESYRNLLSVAGLQQGLFTAKQAEAAGYSDESRVYQVRVGNWFRKARGVYQLADYPATERPDLVLWSLWTRGVDDQPQGVYSHQTALALHDLSDLQPAKLHLTVPPTFRRRSRIPDGLVLHVGVLSDSEVEEGDGYRVTRPIRAILDLLRGGDVHPEILREALRDGVTRGLITLDEERRAEENGLFAALRAKEGP
jgi:hypothetical protein